jgi:hypothetical protein
VVEWVTLAEAVQVLREELTVARDNGADQDIQFDVGPVEIEFAVVAKRSGGGKVGLTFLVPLGIEGGLAKEETHRVKVTLTPRDRETGESPRVNDRMSTLPDR